MGHYFNVKNELKHIIANTIKESLNVEASLSLDEIINLIEKPKKKGFGDLAFPCFSVAKALKTSPIECANNLSQSIALPKEIEKAIPTGPFLNFFFEKSNFIDLALKAVSSKPKRDKKETVIIEYSSPNIAKQFHVGHLRTTLIGNCLDRVYRYLDYNAISINHLGDWGTQFGFVFAGCKVWGKPKNETLEELVDLYRKATSLKESQEKDPNTITAEEPDVNKIARDYFLDLEEGKEDALEFWKWCLEISLTYLDKLYKRLDIKFDHQVGESFYSDKLDSVKADLENAGILKESDGAYGIDLGEELGFARVYTPDGRSLYLTRDLATVDYRDKTFNFDQTLYVVGAPQSLHFKQLISILEKLNKNYSNKIEHVAFGHVLGMKTRGGGEFVELGSFIDEAYERSLKSYNEQVSKRPDNLNQEQVAEAVALSAIIFSNLSKTRLKDVHFKWEHALEFQGDSGPYLLYAYARVNGIIEKALESEVVSSKELNSLTHNSSLLTEESAYNLSLEISEFNAALEKTIKDSEPCHLSTYLLNLAKAFSKAYQELKVVGVEADLAKSRLALFKATQEVLGKGLHLLGIKTVERM